MLYKAKVAVCSEIRTKHSSQSEHHVEFIKFIKTNHLMMYKVKVAVCSEIRTKHWTQSEHHVEFLNVKPGGT
jgi:DNA-dependent RNA polymerase auxiliary subunit epsilon